MNQLFNFNGNEVRVVLKDGDPWFVAKDVCTVLELSNPTMAIQRLDEDEVTKFNLGGLQGEANAVNESGLYSLVLGSRKPEARAFKKWITSEVIPTIRKHGAYMTPETIERTLMNPDFIIGLAGQLKAEQTARQQAEKMLEEQKHFVHFAKSLQISEDSILVADLAKLLKQNGIDIGERRLFAQLREEGYLIKSGSEYNMPTQRSMDLKIMEIRIGHRGGSDGTIRITRTPKITGKGQIYFINKYKKSA